ncbi:guanylyl cyclase-activating protein 2-like [Clupea harengus]|uniref:Guanylyl cyclase-activating protein 2-like n=1 Tax=Clupea harengus TaxID=7950 RepID=A0A6P3W070_CLUHA|nr:guanylyl cyclase-activating protein 2-like [Clupea harengus]
MGQGESAEHEEVDLVLIQDLSLKFMKECPSGALHLHEFKRIFGVQSTSEEETIYIETIFHSFDTNRDNKLDFMEYIAALHLVLRGRLEDRLKWSFKMYDTDGNGRLDRQEIKHIIKIICKMKTKNTDTHMTPNEMCDRIFELVDENHDGQISLAEFMEGAQKDEWLMEMLKLDFNASGWVNQNWVKKTP